MFRPMRTLMDAPLQDFYTDIKQASTSFITFFNFFLVGVFCVSNISLPMIYDVANRL